MSNYDEMYGDRVFMEPENSGQKHLACAVLVDVSGSMLKDNAIGKLNEALQVFRKALLNDEQARDTVDVSIVSFSSQVKTVVPFTRAERLEIPVLEADGMTAMNEAIITGLDLVENKTKEYKAFGTPYFQPWVFLLTDGAATDDHCAAMAKARIREAVTKNKPLTFFPFGIGPNADMAALKEYNNGGNAFQVESADSFKKLFIWISQSMSVVVNSTQDATKATLPPLPEGTIIVNI